jgi:hypothetical protein
MERKKAMTIAKGEKSKVRNNGNNRNNVPSRKGACHGGSGGAQPGRGVSIGGSASGSGGGGSGQ